MSDAAVLLVVAAIASAAVVIAVRAINARARRTLRWVVDDYDVAGGVQVIIRRGDRVQRIGAPVTLDDRFNDAIEERRAEAYERAVGLNSGLPR